MTFFLPEYIFFSYEYDIRPIIYNEMQTVISMWNEYFLYTQYGMPRFLKYVEIWWRKCYLDFYLIRRNYIWDIEKAYTYKWMLYKGGPKFMDFHVWMNYLLKENFLIFSYFHWGLKDEVFLTDFLTDSSYFYVFYKFFDFSINNRTMANFLFDDKFTIITSVDITNVLDILKYFFNDFSLFSITYLDFKDYRIDIVMILNLLIVFILIYIYSLIFIFSIFIFSLFFNNIYIYELVCFNMHWINWIFYYYLKKFFGNKKKSIYYKYFLKIFNYFKNIIFYDVVSFNELFIFNKFFKKFIKNRLKLNNSYLFFCISFFFLFFYSFIFYIILILKILFKKIINMSFNFNYINWGFKIWINFFKPEFYSSYMRYMFGGNVVRANRKKHFYEKIAELKKKRYESTKKKNTIFSNAWDYWHTFRYVIYKYSDIRYYDSLFLIIFNMFFFFRKLSKINWLYNIEDINFYNTLNFYKSNFSNLFFLFWRIYYLIYKFDTNKNYYFLFNYGYFCFIIIKIFYIYRFILNFKLIIFKYNIVIFKIIFKNILNFYFEVVTIFFKLSKLWNNFKLYIQFKIGNKFTLFFNFWNEYIYYYFKILIFYLWYYNIISRILKFFFKYLLILILMFFFIYFIFDFFNFFFDMVRYSYFVNKMDWRINSDLFGTYKYLTKIYYKFCSKTLRFHRRSQFYLLHLPDEYFTEWCKETLHLIVHKKMSARIYINVEGYLAKWAGNHPKFSQYGLYKLRWWVYYKRWRDPIRHVIEYNLYRYYPGFLYYMYHVKDASFLHYFVMIFLIIKSFWNWIFFYSFFYLLFFFSKIKYMITIFNFFYFFYQWFIYVSYLSLYYFILFFNKYLYLLYLDVNAIYIDFMNKFYIEKVALWLKNYFISIIASKKYWLFKVDLFDHYLVYKFIFLYDIYKIVVMYVFSSFYIMWIFIYKLSYVMEKISEFVFIFFPWKNLHFYSIISVYINKIFYEFNYLFIDITNIYRHCWDYFSGNGGSWRLIQIKYSKFILDFSVRKNGSNNFYTLLLSNFFFDKERLFDFFARNQNSSNLYNTSFIIIFFYLQFYLYSIFFVIIIPMFFKFFKDKSFISHDLFHTWENLKTDIKLMNSVTETMWLNEFSNKNYLKLYSSDIFVNNMFVHNTSGEIGKKISVLFLDQFWQKNFSRKTKYLFLLLQDYYKNRLVETKALFEAMLNKNYYKKMTKNNRWMKFNDFGLVLKKNTINKENEFLTKKIMEQYKKRWELKNDLKPEVLKRQLRIRLFLDYGIRLTENINLERQMPFDNYKQIDEHNFYETIEYEFNKNYYFFNFMLPILYHTAELNKTMTIKSTMYDIVEALQKKQYFIANREKFENTDFFDIKYMVPEFYKSFSFWLDPKKRKESLLGYNFILSRIKGTPVFVPLKEFTKVDNFQAKYEFKYVTKIKNYLNTLYNIDEKYFNSIFMFTAVEFSELKKLVDTRTSPDAFQAITNVFEHDYGEHTRASVERRLEGDDWTPLFAKEEILNNYIGSAFEKGKKMNKVGLEIETNFIPEIWSLFIGFLPVLMVLFYLEEFYNSAGKRLHWISVLTMYNFLIFIGNFLNTNIVFELFAGWYAPEFTFKLIRNFAVTSHWIHLILRNFNNVIWFDLEAAIIIRENLVFNSSKWVYNFFNHFLSWNGIFYQGFILIIYFQTLIVFLEKNVIIYRKQT